jgi:hypothetical protein
MCQKTMVVGIDLGEYSVRWYKEGAEERTELTKSAKFGATIAIA